jgi:hypothetical protein
MDSKMMNPASGGLVSRNPTAFAIAYSVTTRIADIHWAYRTSLARADELTAMIIALVFAPPVRLSLQRLDSGSDMPIG